MNPRLVLFGMATATVTVPLSGDGLHSLGPSLPLALILAFALHALLLFVLPRRRWALWKIALWLICLACCWRGLAVSKAPVPFCSAVLLEGTPLIALSQRLRKPMPFDNHDDRTTQPPQSGLALQRRPAPMAPSLRRADPQAAFPRSAFELPWSHEAKLRDQARKLTLQADFDVFRSDLNSLRAAREAFGRVAAQCEAETAAFEMRCRQETHRYEIVSRDHLDLAQRFMAKLEAFEAFRGRPGASPEMIDAMKERALEEFVACMNRISKIDAKLPDSKPVRGNS